MKEVINQVFEIEQKAAAQKAGLFDRNLRRLYHEFEREGYVVKDPLGEKFSEQRTDIDATIMGELNGNLKITKVLKPIIFKKEHDSMLLVQKGVVLVGVS
ncbi:hypothetical protein [Maribacter sp. 2-571]|uniref:hypothetical protein n=1 Tax=Maribacter sp. 2-571 TaxID=3417569 RepID=UPI003D325B53